MKKIFTFLLGLILFGIPVLAQQDSVTALVFTEYYGRSPDDAYYELTNMGDSALDLSNFWLGIVPGWANASTFDWTGPIPKIMPTDNNWGRRLDAVKIEPGESLIVNNVYDSPGGDGENEGWQRWTWNRPEFFATDHYFPVQVQDDGEHEFWNRPELEMHGKDSIASADWMCYLWNGLGAVVLFYVYPDGSDSVLVDQVRLAKNPSGDNLDPAASDVAGVSAASWNQILVRKADIKKGNTNWDVARGIDLSDSEWMPVPAYDNGLQGHSRERAYTTVGTHGNFSIDLTSESVTINDTENKLTVPWGVLKYDSLLNEFSIGDGMAWKYSEDDQDFADSAHSIVQTGDMIKFMAFGNNYEEKEYSIEVAAPAADMALVFPLRRMRYEAIAGNNFNGQYWGGTPYYVTEEVPGMDSVANVPYGTRVDTLLTYLEKAPNANWEIDFVDDQQRVDLIDGDKLIVTAEDGTTIKEYYIAVLDYEKNDNALLSAITWPDKPYYLDGWKGDTIPNFNPTSQSYQITLPYGTKKVPAFTASTQDMNAKITIDRATSLSGSQQERTTTFNVTSEDDSITLAYKVLFSVEKRPEDIQLYKAEPIISEMAGSKRHYYELANLGDVPLDMSKYLFAWTSSGATPAQAITSIGANTDLYAFTTRYRFGYVPGYKFSDDTITWQANPAKLEFDAAVNPVVDPGDVFVIGNLVKSKWIKFNALSQTDVVTNFGNDWITQLDTNYNTWGQVNLVSDLQMGMHWDALYLFRIDNDSILEGTKAMNADPTDYTLIDMVGQPGLRWQDMWIGEHQRRDWNAHLTMRRKANIYAGNPDADSASNRDNWVSNDQADAGFSDAYQFIGGHTFDPVTAHKSTVSSLVYLVSIGYQGVQTIQGDLGTSTVDTFFGNISKADPGQTISVIDGTDSSVKDLTDNIADNDTLVVVSKDGLNTTKYALIDLPLDDNAVITTVDGASLTIEIDGANGLIKGVNYGAVLETVMDSLIIPELASATILDQEGNPIPYLLLNYDTVKVNTVIGDQVFIEVVAQNGVNKITYKFEPAAESSEAFVISSIYAVDQANNTISGLPMGTGASLFWKNIEVVKGATATLLDKAGFERTQGNLNFDDKLEVVSADQSVTKVYYLNFLTEMNPDGNQAPVVTLAATTINIVDELETTVSATVEDDGLPFGSDLLYSWEVTEGDAADVTFTDAAALSTVVTFADTGMFKLTFTADDTERSTSASVSVHVTSTVGIQDNLLKSKIYPNPAKDRLFVELDNMASGQAMVKIVDITGNIVYSDVQETSNAQIDISQFKSGVYFVTISNASESLTNKLYIIR